MTRFKERTQVDELVVRMRRLETRITNFLQLHGHVLMQPPQWYEGGVILVHDDATPIGEIMRVIPPDWDEDQKIVLRRGMGPGGFIAELYLSEEGDGNE